MPNVKVVKGIEYKGRIILKKQPTPLLELWFIAKNKGMQHVDEYAKIWCAHKMYGCEYTQLTIR